MGLRKLYQNIWWAVVPGKKIKVEWPVGKITVDHNDPRWVDLGGAVWVELESADPNDHYRPWMEQYVGRQDWDWGWNIENNDAAENRLTIKFRKGKEKWATMAVLRWS